MLVKPVVPISPPAFNVSRLGHCLQYLLDVACSLIKDKVETPAAHLLVYLYRHAKVSRKNGCNHFKRLVVEVQGVHACALIHRFFDAFFMQTPRSLVNNDALAGLYC